MIFLHSTIFNKETHTHKTKLQFPLMIFVKSLYIQLTKLFRYVKPFVKAFYRTKEAFKG